MRCPNCQTDSPSDARFCAQCGTSLARGCLQCGAAAAAEAHFCRDCGQPLTARPSPGAPRTYTPQHLAERILTTRAALEGERKQVTVLFADVQGSMDLAEQLDAEQWHGVLDRFFRTMTEGVHRFEGTVNQYTGDGIMALFGAPIAHEDHAQRACAAALHLRGALREYAAELRRTRGLNFSVRMGMNSGEVVVGKIGDDLRMDYTAQGHTVGLAGRIERLAAPDTVSITDATARLVESQFLLRDLGAFELKGSRDPVRVWELQGPGPMRTRLEVSRARGLSRFVGRGNESAALDSALEHARAGRGQVVGVVGEAGVGKSRLCLEFAERCRAANVAVCEVHCQRHARSVPWLPALEMMRGLLGIEDPEDDAQTLIAIAQRFPPDGEENAILGDFMGVPRPERTAPPLAADEHKRRLWALARGLVHERSDSDPLLVVVDDLHWIDDESNELLASIAGAAPASRLLLLVNFRPGYRADWMGRSHYQQLALQPLAGDEAGAMLDGLLGDGLSVRGLRERLRDQSGGTPLFIEELVKSLAESGSLVGARGAYRLVESIAEVRIPATIQAVIGARIDRLAERDKRVLQIASVIGKRFPEPVLRRVAELEEAELDAALEALGDTELLQQEALLPESRLAFRHPLTRQVAYDSQLSEHREVIHAAVAEALEALYADRVGENAALIAHHWEAARRRHLARRWRQRAALGVTRIQLKRPGSFRNRRR